MKCPKCNYENQDGALYCGMCSEVFNKKPVPAVAATPARPAAGTGNVPARPWMWCLLALVAASFITNKVFLIWFPFRFIKVVAHELGHTALYLLFGHIAIPGVNPLDTGGVALSVSYIPGFPYAMIALLLLATYAARKYNFAVLTGALITIAYALLAFTDAKEWLIAAGGILAEYILAGVCLYFCLFWEKFKFGVERLLCGILGWHALIEEIGYLLKLRTDKALYDSYASGAGWQAGMTGDLAKIAFDINYKFSVNSFDTIVTLFTILGFVPLVIVGYLAINKSHT